MLVRLLGLSFAYGLGFTLIKSLFPSPVILMIMYEGETSEGDLGTLALVYMASGLIGGIVGGMLFGLALLGRKALRGGFGGNAPRIPRSAAGLSMGLGLGLSLGMAAVISIISTLLTVSAYQFGLLPSGGVLDPLTLIHPLDLCPGPTARHARRSLPGAARGELPPEALLREPPGARRRHSGTGIPVRGVERYRMAGMARCSPRTDGSV
jgi:hypothetical protein